MHHESHGKRHMHRAAELLKSAEVHLKEATADVVRVTPAGDFRRGCELIGDLTLVAEVSKLAGGPKTIRAGGQLAAHLTDAARYGVTLLDELLASFDFVVASIHRQFKMDRAAQTERIVRAVANLHDHPRSCDGAAAVAAAGL
jgi:hypothetical protein